MKKLTTEYKLLKFWFFKNKKYSFIKGKLLSYTWLKEKQAKSEEYTNYLKYRDNKLKMIKSNWK